MHKGLLSAGLALLLTGCATSQSEAPPVQVDDLSTGRAASVPAEYTVESGDTLYGIAWRHDMDYRDLAEMNGIAPPYNIQPGQTLALGGSGRQAAEATQRSGAERSGNDGAVATGVAAAGAVAGGAGSGAESSATASRGASSGGEESLDWLLPEDGSSDRSSSRSSSTGSADAESSADGTPGPVYENDDASNASADEAVSDTSGSGDENADERAATDDTTDDTTDDNSADNSAATEASGEGATGSEASDSAASTSASADEQATEERRYTPVDEVPWQWPTEGSVVGNYGEGDSITAGIDIDGQKGQPVKAAGPGIVVYAGSGVRGYGQLILLKHNDQYLSAYAHNDSLNVKENDVVRAGEVIATMGDSDAQDVRLHFEVRKDGQPQDPLEYLPAR